jgi:hypothetical protein
MNARINIQIRTIFLTILCLCGITTAQEAMPEDAARLKKSWQDARARAVEPLDEKYRQELDKLLQAHTKAGRLDAALAIRAELASMQTANATAKDVSVSSGDQKMSASDVAEQFVGKKWATEMWAGKWQIWDFRKAGEVIITRAKEGRVEPGEWYVDKETGKVTIEHGGTAFSFSLITPTEGVMTAPYPTGTKEFKLLLRP